MTVLTDMVRLALQELSDESYQRRVWTGRGGDHEMSSFTECVSRLFDDSGLDLALERDQPIFGTRIDADLQALGDLTARMDSSRSPDEIIGDPLMNRVRDRATKIIQALGEGGDELATDGTGK